MTEVSDDERLARAALTGLSEPGNVNLSRFVAEHGPEATLQAIEDGSYPGNALRDLQAKLAASDPGADLDRAAKAGAWLVCPGDPEWPPQLEVLAETESTEGAGGVPLALWVRGSLELGMITQRACAIVGARSATQYGTHVAEELAAGLADRGVTIVSGGAFGIDVAAHRGALAANGYTVAVLACGVDIPYPRAHAALFDRIADEGLLVSEVPPGATPRRQRFLVRNRLIAALSEGTVVVEAALRSGALNTAAWANRCQREVMAIPGSVLSPQSAGTNQLIRDAGAVLVTDADEIAEQIGRIGDDLAPVKAGEQRARDALDRRSQQVLECVPVQQFQGIAQLAAAAGVPVDETLAVLGHLLLLGFVEHVGAGWRLSAAERTRNRHASTVERTGS